MSSVIIHKYPHMFEPLVIRGTVFKNRVMAAPISTGFGAFAGGVPTQEGLSEYETRARGGVGAVTVAAAFVDRDRGAHFGEGLALAEADYDENRLKAILMLTETIRCHGAVAAVQLNHTGEANHPEAIASGRNPIGPTGYFRADGVTVEEMTPADMKRIAESFAQTALRAQEAGFQMISLHGGYGWLLQQFLSPLTNRRTDRFGGCLENRARFPRMVVKAVREAVGADMLIEYILSADERIDGGLQLPDAVAFCRQIQDDVDLIQVTSGHYRNYVESKAVSSAYDDHCCNLSLAAAVKKAVHIPVVAVGGFNAPEQIEAALEEKKCDFVALGRQMLADPEFVRKTAEGRENLIAPCLRCSCFNPIDPCSAQRSHPETFCAVNPEAMRSVQLRLAPPVVRKQKILVVGGGPGGMYAAITAAQRGHTVRLVEKSDKLGGLTWVADVCQHKEDLRRFRDSLIARCEAAGVEIALKTIGSRLYIEKYKPDAVIAAIGAEPYMPPIPGLAVFAHHALWAYENPALVGHRVVIIGSGLTGMECAIHLAEKSGCEVTVLGRSSEFAREASASSREAIELFLPQSVTVRGGVQVTSVRPNGAAFRARNGRTVEVEADTVLYAVGMQPARAEAFDLLNVHPNTRLVGDCREPGRVMEAVRDGLFAAYDII